MESYKHTSRRINNRAHDIKRASDIAEKQIVNFHNRIKKIENERMIECKRDTQDTDTCFNVRQEQKPRCRSIVLCTKTHNSLHVVGRVRLRFKEQSVSDQVNNICFAYIA